LPEPTHPPPQGLAGAQLQGESVDGLYVIDGAPEEAVLDREPDLEVRGLEHDRRAWPRLRWLALGLGRHQVARVGMLWPLEYRRRLALLDHLAAIHDVDAVGHAPDDPRSW